MKKTVNKKGILSVVLGLIGVHVFMTSGWVDEDIIRGVFMITGLVIMVLSLLLAHYANKENTH